MNTAVTAPQASQQPARRPLGVWILTLYDGIFVGLLPLVSTLAVLVMYWSGRLATDSGVSPSMPLAAALLLEAGVVIAAVGTWRGKATAKNALLVLLLLNFVFVVIQNAAVIQDGSVPARVVTRAQAAIFRAGLMLVINGWYFLGGRVRAFYQ